MNWATVGEFVSRHKEALGLFALAMAVTMRPKLPWPFSRIELLEWGYEWLRDGLLTFVSMRGPAHSEVSVEKTEKAITDDGGKTVETTSSVKAEGTHDETQKNLP